MFVSFDGGHWCVVASWRGLAGDELGRQFICFKLIQVLGMSKLIENLKFCPISKFECDNPESIGISYLFTLHVASLGTALPNEFGSFPPDSFSFCALLPTQSSPQSPPNLAVRQCNTGRVKKHACPHYFSAVQEQIPKPLRYSSLAARNISGDESTVGCQDVRRIPVRIQSAGLEPVGSVHMDEG